MDIPLATTENSSASHGLLMGWAWAGHGMPMVYPWAMLHTIPMGYA